MDAYSRDLRVRILEDCDGGMTTRVAATKYRVWDGWDGDFHLEASR